MSKLIKDEALEEAGAYAETDKHETWQALTNALTVITLALGLILAYPVAYLIHGRAHFERTFASLDLADPPRSQRQMVVNLVDAEGRALPPGSATRYFLDAKRIVLPGPGESRISPILWLYFYPGRWVLAEWRTYQRPPIVLLVFLLLPTTVFMLGRELNPHRKNPNIYGETRWAKVDDVEQMAKRNLIGFASGTANPKSLFVVGKFDDRLIKMGETLSVLLLAPPGTGKSIGFVVPSLVELDRSSVFVHDQKPELWDMTSGHRQKLGPCFQLKWAAQDAPDGRWVTSDEARLLAPELLETGPDGHPLRHPETGDFKTKPIFYPSWNPLSPKCLPAPGPKRDMYLERLASVLCPDPDSGGDKFWTSRARAAIVGLSHYLCAKVEAATDPDLGGSWDGIPKAWVGKEASYPMLVDWFAWAQSEIDDGTDDPLRTVLRHAVDESKALDDLFQAKRGFRCLNRAIVELTNLAQTPDKTRGSILTTVDDGLSPFKVESVRQRTSSCDFSFADLRGIPLPEARAREEAKVEAARQRGEIYRPRYAKEEYQPVSIYVSVAMEDAKALAKITGIFVDSANAYLVANGPSTIDDQGFQVGPFPFGFILDEAPQLPKLDTVINGPAVGRSKQVYYVIVGQDFGQFEQRYSKAEVETLKSTTAIKIVLSQNNESAVRPIVAAAGKSTVVKHSLSKSQPKDIFTKIGDAFSNKAGGQGPKWSESYEAIDFLNGSFLMSLPEGKHIVLVQNFMNRPILADTPRFFTETKAYDTPSALARIGAAVLKRPLPMASLPIADRVFNLRSHVGPHPAPPMPLAYMQEARERLTGQKADEAKIAARRQALSEPRHVIIATPKDMAALSRDEFAQIRLGEAGRMYACAAVEIHPHDSFVPEIREDALFLTEDVAEVAAMVGHHRFYVFDEATLESQLNAPLRAKGLPALPREQAVFLARQAEAVGETPGEDIYFLGHQGSSSLELPTDLAHLTPHFVITWIAECITTCLGVLEMQRAFAVAEDET